MKACPGCGEEVEKEELCPECKECAVCCTC